MAQDGLAVSTHGNVMHITLDRPDRLNVCTDAICRRAIPGGMIDAGGSGCHVADPAEGRWTFRWNITG
jgi:hypothetical protein